MEMATLRNETSLIRTVRDDIERRGPHKRASSKVTARGLRMDVMLVLAGAFGVGLLLAGFLAPVSTAAGEKILVLWQVQTAVAVIAPPLLLLVLEFARGDERPGLRRAEVLRRQSGLLPTAAFALAGVLLDGVAAAMPASAWAFCLGLGYLILTLTFVLWTFIVVLRLVVESGRLRLIAGRLVEGDIARSVRSAAEIRIARSRFSAFLSEVGAEVWFLGTDDPAYAKASVPLASHDVLRITDVNPKRLAAALSGVPLRLPDVPSAEPTPAKTGPSVPERKQSPPIRLTRALGDLVGPVTPLVVSFSREFFALEENGTESVGQELKGSFVTEPEVEHAPENTALRAHLEHLRDRALECFGAGLARQAEDHLEDYRRVLELFLKEMSAYAAVYGEELAPTGRFWLREDWNELEWLREDLRSFTYQVASSGSLESTVALLGFVRHLAVTAVRPHDNGPPDLDSFRQLVMQFPAICSMLDSASEEKRALAVNHTALLLSELGVYWIDPRLQEATRADEALIAERCWLALLAAFSSALKTAYEQGHVRDFRALAEAMVGTADQVSLRRTGLSDGTGEDGENPDIEAARERMMATMNLVLVGIDAWIVSRYVDGRLHRDDFAVWRSLIPLAPSLSESWNLMLQALEVEDSPGEPFGWGWWEGAARPGRIEVRAARFSSLILQAWCLRAMELLDDMEPEARTRQAVPPVRDVPFWMDSNGELSGVLTRLEERQAFWAPLFASDVTQLTGALRSLLEEAAALQTRQEDQAIVEAPLSPSRAVELHTRIAAAWRRHTVFRALVGDAGGLSIELEAPPYAPGLWLDHLDRKEAYIDQREGGPMFYEWGEAYGRSMALGENQRALSAVFKDSRIERTTSSETDGLTSVKEAVKRLGAGGRRLVVLAVGRADVMVAFRRTAGYAVDMDEDGRLGWLDDVPVYRVDSDAAGWVLVADLGRLGHWLQFSPVRLEGDEILEGVLGISVEPFNEASAGSLLARQPDLFDSQPALSQEQKIWELLKSVRLRINERFEYVIEDPEAASVVLLQATRH